MEQNQPEVRIKNLRKSEYILGAIQIFREVRTYDKDQKKEVISQVEDYVRPAEIIRPGEASQPLTIAQLKVFDTPSMQFARLAGELDILVDGKSLRKPDPAPERAKSLTRAESDDTAEARQLAALLGGGPKPTEE